MKKKQTNKYTFQYKICVQQRNIRLTNIRKNKLSSIIIFICTSMVYMDSVSKKGRRKKKASNNIIKNSFFVIQ
eukprot:UN10877